MGSPVTAVSPLGIPLALADPIPPGASQLTATSGNQANASAVATLAAAAGKTTYIMGFDVTGSGATAGLPVAVTVAGLLGGSITFTYTAAVGALVPNTPLPIRFPAPIPAAAPNTPITVTCAALGAGSTNNVVNAYGYQL
jgi:hypothetical protein